MKLFESGIFYIHQRKTGDTVDLLNEKKKKTFLKIEKTI